MVWLPIESNPDILNKFLQKLGITEKFNIVDVYGLDSDTLAFIAKPVLSVILLFPRSQAYLNYSAQERDFIKANGQIISPELFFIRQVVSNASGTVSLIHSIANNMDETELADGKLKELLEMSKNLSPEDRGELLLTRFAQLLLVHQEVALEGQTEFNPNDTVKHHFVTFVHKDGYLYELDGRKEFPINHGRSSSETLLEDAARVCKRFIEREPGEINFSVMALTVAEI